MAMTESLTGKKLTEDQNLSKIQDQLGSQLGGMFGKGGVGEGLGSVLSKGLWMSLADQRSMNGTWIEEDQAEAHD